MKEDRLGDRLALGRGDDQERRRRVTEQRLDRRRPLAEAVDQPAERAEQLRDVVEQSITAGCHLFSAPRTFEVAGVQPSVVWKRGQPLVELTAQTLKAQQFAIKRVVDVVGATRSTSRIKSAMASDPPTMSAPEFKF